MTINIKDTDLLCDVSKNGQGAVLVGDEVYKRERPEILTDAIEKAVDDYRVDYTAAVISAVGAKAIDSILADNPECDKVVGKSNMGASDCRIQMTTYREEVVSNNGENHVIKGSTMVAVFTPYQSISGPIKSSLDHITEQAIANSKKTEETS